MGKKKLSKSSQKQSKGHTVKFNPSTLGQNLMTVEELRKLKAPDNIFKHIQESKPSKDREGLAVCGASTWDVPRVSQWAEDEYLPQVLACARRCNFSGGDMLRMDALQLQKFGVTSGREALVAEELLSRQAVTPDHDIGDSRDTPIHLYTDLYKGEQPCLGHLPIDMLSTDPWRRRQVRFLQNGTTTNLF